MRVIRLILVFVLIPILAVSIINLVSCSPSPENNQQGSGGSGSGQGGGTTIETVKILGSITNYSSPWKIQAVKGSEIRNGTIDSSQTPATYEIVVPKNWGLATVRLYKDNNNNNQFDAGEEQITANVNVGSSDITQNFEIPLFVTISGTINNYQSGWKVGALVGTGIPTLVLGNIQGGNYSISVVSNSYVQSVITFKDNNGNNEYDSGETYVSTNINNNLTSDLTGVNFTLPNLNQMNISVTVNGNTFGKRVGVIAFSQIGTIAYSTPSTDASKTHTITIDSTTGDTISIAIYIDENNNNNFNSTNISIFNIFLEPIIFITNIQFDSQGVTLPDINLIGHTISGQLQLQNGASGFKPAVLYGNASGLYTPLSLGVINNNNYEIKFYTVSDFTNTNINIVMFKDQNNDGLFNFLNEKAVYFRNLGPFSSSAFPISIDPTTPNNITTNITILRTLLNLTLTGTDASDFNFVDTNPIWGLFVGTPYLNLPVNNYEIYSDAEDIANNPNALFLILFKDYNGNGIYEGAFSSLEDIEYISPLLITDPSLTSTNINLELVKLVVTNVINGSYTPSPSNYISSTGSGPGGLLRTPNYQMQGITNVTIHYGVRLASSGDPVIIEIYNSFATNDQGYDTISIPITTDSNITIDWYVQ